MARAREHVRWPLVFVAVVATLAMLASGAMLALRAVVHRYDSTVSRATLIDPNSRDVDPNSPDPMGRLRAAQVSGPLNYLLIGSDKRAGDPEAGQRSDTIIIVHIDRDLGRADLISIPRDLLVEIPPYESAGFAGGEDKINAAFDYGGGGAVGVQLLSATLTRLTGLHFIGAAIIEFSGFRKVIDLIGGVNLCVDTEVRSIHTGKLYPVGCRTMNGADSLDYSRQRYGLPAGDYDRQRHQQQLLKAIFTRTISNGTAYNPFKLDQLIREVGRTLTVDTGGVSLTELLFALRNLQPDSLSGIKVPSYPTDIGATSYVLLQDPEADSLFAAARVDDLSAWEVAHRQWVNPI